MLFLRLSTLIIIALIPSISTAGGVTLKTISLRNGIESQISLNWPLKDKDRIYTSKYYLDDLALAKETGLNLADYLENTGVAYFNPQKEKFFLLFYNLVHSTSCPREYLVQRVKIRKIDYDHKKKVATDNTIYLVEIMKLKRNNIKRADRHMKQYGLNKAFKRSVFVECEIGCGTIADVATGTFWPFKGNSLYKLLQDYSPTKGLYNEVRFDFSRKYTFSFHFSRNGKKSITWPYFMK